MFLFFILIFLYQKQYLQLELHVWWTWATWLETLSQAYVCVFWYLFFCLHDLLIVKSTPRQKYHATTVFREVFRNIVYIHWMCPTVSFLWWSSFQSSPFLAPQVILPPFSLLACWNGGNSNSISSLLSFSTMELDGLKYFYIFVAILYLIDIYSIYRTK